MHMDQDTCQFFHQDFSKYHETKINEGALKIVTRDKNGILYFKEHCIKIDDISLLFYTSFSLSQKN